MNSQRSSEVPNFTSESYDLAFPRYSAFPAKLVDGDPTLSPEEREQFIEILCTTDNAGQYYNAARTVDPEGYLTGTAAGCHPAWRKKSAGKSQPTLEDQRLEIISRRWEYAAEKLASKADYCSKLETALEYLRGVPQETRSKTYEDKPYDAHDVHDMFDRTNKSFNMKLFRKIYEIPDGVDEALTRIQWISYWEENPLKRRIEAKRASMTAAREKRERKLTSPTGSKRKLLNPSDTAQKKRTRAPPTGGIKRDSTILIVGDEALTSTKSTDTLGVALEESRANGKQHSGKGCDKMHDPSSTPTRNTTPFPTAWHAMSQMIVDHVNET
ncbi:MAG: hypothetical protein AAFY15_16315, partial [Cyanobacteria bacterium J06648_11]